MTQSGIEPETFRLVAQCHYTSRNPQFWTLVPSHGTLYLKISFLT